MAAGTVVVDTIKSSASLTPPVFKDSAGLEIGQLVRAWCRFHSTTSTAVDGSFNVASVTDNGTGDTTVNFTNALPSANYSWAVGAQASTSAAQITFAPNAAAPSTSAFRFVTYTITNSAPFTGAAGDGLYTSLIIVGG